MLGKKLECWRKQYCFDRPPERKTALCQKWVKYMLKRRGNPHLNVRSNIFHFSEIMCSICWMMRVEYSPTRFYVDYIFLPHPWKHRLHFGIRKNCHKIWKEQCKPQNIKSAQKRGCILRGTEKIFCVDCIAMQVELYVTISDVLHLESNSSWVAQQVRAWIGTSSTYDWVVHSLDWMAKGQRGRFPFQMKFVGQIRHNPRWGASNLRVVFWEEVGIEAQMSLFSQHTFTKRADLTQT